MKPIIKYKNMKCPELKNSDTGRNDYLSRFNKISLIKPIWVFFMNFNKYKHVKKILFVLLILISFFQQEAISQIKAGNEGFEYLGYSNCNNGGGNGGPASKCTSRPSCVTTPSNCSEGDYPEAKGVFNGSVLNVTMEVIYKCPNCSERRLGIHHSEHQLNNIQRGVWNNASYLLRADDSNTCPCLGTFTYRYYRKPDAPSLSLANNPSNIYNEFDTVKFQTTPGYGKIIYRKIATESWSIVDTIESCGDNFNIILDNLGGIKNATNIFYKARTINLSEDDNNINKSNNCSAPLCITVYPSRPKITSVKCTAPSCYGGGDGTITINDIDGAIGHAVAMYKVSFKRGACKNAADTLLDLEGTSPIMAPKIEDYRYFTNFPITFDTTMFENNNGQNPIVGDSTYCILIENVYSFGDSLTLSNGHTFTNVSIPKKEPLTPLVTEKALNCYGDSSGQISLEVFGGNPYYDAYLYNAQNEKIDSAINLSNEGTISKTKSHTFRNLSAGDYAIQLIDTNHCHVFVNGSDIGSNTISGIKISQPDSLKLINLGTDDVLCNGEHTGRISLRASGGRPIFQKNSGKFYRLNVFKKNEMYIKEYHLASGKLLTIDTLESSYYRLQLIDNNNCKTTYLGFQNKDSSFIITEPKDKLIIKNIELVDYNGIQISCNGADDGQIIVNSEGGTGAHSFIYRQKYSFMPDTSFSNTITGLKPAVYKITVKDENNCTEASPKDFIINEPPQLKITGIELSNYNDFNISCKNGSNGYITVEGKGGWGNYRYINGSGNNADTLYTNFIKNLRAGSKKITLIDKNNCKIDTTVNLKEPASLPQIVAIDTVSYNGFGVHCNGDSDGMLHVVADQTSGTTINGTFEYSIDNGQNFQDEASFSGLPAGTYNIKIKDANDCLSNDLSNTVTITEPELLRASVSDTLKYGTFHIACKGDTNGGFKIVGKKGVPAYKYFLDGTEITNGFVSNKAAGTYSYYVSDKNECVSATGNIELTEPDEISYILDTASYNGNHAIRCFGLRDSVKIKASGGYVSSNYRSYLKFDGDSLYKPINPGDSTYFTIKANTAYGLKIIDQNNCIKETELFTPTEPDKMHLLFKDTIPTLCHNTADGKLNVKWSGGTNSFSNTYDYYLKQDNNIIQTINDVDINDTATFFNLWGNKAYRVFALDDNACLDSSFTIFITSPDKLEANNINTQQPSCYGDTVGIFSLSATGGTTHNGNYNFSIKTEYGDSLYQNNAEFAVFENIGRGTHQYFIIDDYNCLSDYASFAIIEPDEMLISTQSGNVSVQGGSDGWAQANVAGGTLASGNSYTYKWRDASGNVLTGENEPVITDYPAGDYSVEVWDDNDCPYGNSSTGLLQYITIHEPGEVLKLHIVQQHNVSTPGGSDGSVSLDAEGGWNQKTYKIGQNGIYTPANIFTDLAAGNYWFYVTDGFSVDSIQTTISEAEALQIEDITIQNISCNGNADGRASILASGGTLPYTYSQDNINYIENNVFENLAEGIHTVYVKDLYGNISSQNFTINQPNMLRAEIGNVQSTSCGESDGLITVVASGGTLPYSYDWYLNETHIGQYDATAENLEAGLYKVLVTDANACTVSAQATVYNSNGPEIESLITSNALCPNSSDGTATISNITASGAYTVLWSTGQTDVMSINGLQAGNYSVRVEDENNCSVTEAFEINAPEQLSFNFNMSSPTCFDGCNGSIKANLTGGTQPYTLEWQNISGNTSTNYVGNLCAGKYILHATDENNCFYSDTANLENPEAIHIFEQDGTTLCQGQNIALDAGNTGSTYQWSSDNNFQSTEQIVTVDKQGTYYVTVITPLGCSASDEFTLNFSDAALQANFLMQSEAEVGDTVVLVEISWEKPDSVSWIFPKELWVLSHSEQNVQLIPTKPGIYTVGLNAYLGTCSDYVEEAITISGERNKNFLAPNYTKHKTEQIKSINLYPNPNKGNFTLDISLYEEDDVFVEIYDILGELQQTYKTGKGEKDYSFNFSINQLNKGIYFVSIRTSKGTCGIKFVKK